MSDAITIFHRARDAGIRFTQDADGRWIAVCSPALWQTWRPAFDGLWPDVLRSLRPPLAHKAPPPKQGAVAWRQAGQAIERAKHPSVPSSVPDAGNPTGKRRTRP